MKKLVKAIGIILTISLLVSCTSLYNDLLDQYGPSNLEPMQTKPSSNPTNSSSQEADNNVDDPQDDPNDATFSAPDFTVLDMDGNEVKLSSFAGKVIVVNFWATWCVYCKQEMPDFQKIYEKYPDIQFVMVNTNDDVNAAKKYISDNGYTFPVFFDIDGAAARAYGVTGYPTSFFINAEGNYIVTGNGMLTYDLIEQGISMVTGE